MKYDKLKSWAWDIECFRKFFSAGFRNMETDEYIEFEISEFKNEARELFKFMSKIIKTESVTIGFNSMFYDQPMMHYFLRVYMSGIKDVEDIHEYMFAHSQWLIHEAERFHRERDPLWQDIDLFKLNHFDNMAKATSLKKIEVFLKMDNIMESSVSFDAYEISYEETIEVLGYQEHDVLATKLLAEYCEKALNFRFSLIEKFGNVVLNYSDSKIGSELMNKELIDKMGYDKIYKMINGKRQPIQTEYPEGIKVKDLIFDYIQFETDAGNAILDFMKSQVLYPDPDIGGTGMKGVFNNLNMNDIGELKNHCEHNLTNTQIRKKNTREYIDQIISGKINGEYDKKGYPVLPVDETGKPQESFQKMGTYRQKYWDFKHLNSEEYKEKWKKKIKDSEGFNYCGETFELPNTLKQLNVVMNGIRIDIGVGGSHQSIEPGYYEENDDYVIIDADIVSMYPSLSIENFLAPKQYDVDAWVDSYGGMKKERLSYKKGTSENLSLKLALNATYGNSGNIHSPIRDPAYTVSTCINGQLTIIKLAEMMQSIEGLKIISINTDGILAFVPREKQDQYKQVCKDFEEKSKLVLEFENYKKLLHRDVNNFMYQ